jgi:hypothetical protein
MSNSPILNAVVSRLIAERDETLVQLDLIVNKNKGSSDSVQETLELIKNLSSIEHSIETVQGFLLENIQAKAQEVSNGLKEKKKK